MKRFCSRDDHWKECWTPRAQAINFEQNDKFYCYPGLSEQVKLSSIISSQIFFRLIFQQQKKFCSGDDHWNEC